MKYLDNRGGAQGDLLFFLVDKLPADVKKINPNDGLYMIAHSETGYHHVVEDSEEIEYFASSDPMVTYMRVIADTECLLEHRKPTEDRHET